jgi:hypothetical protein
LWAADQALHFPELQRYIVHHAFDHVGIKRTGLARLEISMPLWPARAAASASSAVQQGFSRFAYEWTLGRAGEMSRIEREEIERIRLEAEGARLRAHRVIEALHARQIAEQQELINRRVWSAWRARHLLATLNEASADEIGGVLAQAASSCSAACSPSAHTVLASAR